MLSCAWSTQSTGDSRRSSPDADLFVIKRPPQPTFRKLFQSRTPVRYLDSALRINRPTLNYAKRKIRGLIKRHLDISKLYGDLPQSRLDFLKREVLLDTDLSFLTQYEDGWAVDVLIRKVYFERHQMVQEMLRPVRRAYRHNHQSLLTSRSHVSPEPRLSVRRTRANTSSRVAFLSTRLDSATPSLLRFHKAIVQAGLCSDEHLHQLFRMSAASRDTFILQALGRMESTIFERVAVMDILERVNNGHS
ncbi:hypothetical protein EDD22DRAFT_236746 [Suillus occidentalis]|nr:hypothetical protein EDD22DRAFT_236746 [Suillus occidentalis]